MSAIDSSFDAPLSAHSSDDATLGRIVFGARSGQPDIENGVPTLRMQMVPNADAAAGFVETWRASGPVRSGRQRDLVFAHDSDMLFCAGFIEASAHYTDATQRAYEHAFALIRELGFQRLFRMWNFIASINGANREGLEVYRDFCRGRAMAFERDDAMRASMPAATGIGTWGEGIAFYLLACRESAVTHIENTRQTPAYAYPLRYGPKPPSFARATLVSGAREMLFVSGTASILGAETVHAGDLDKQFEVTTANIAHLIGAGNLARQGVRDGFTLAELDRIKVYYRHAHDLPRVMQLARDAFHAQASVRFVNADICRADLLVEIEGIASRVVGVRA